VSIPPEHLTRARYHLDRGLSTLRARYALQAEGYTDGQALAAVEEIIRVQRLEISTKQDALRAQLFTAAQALLERIYKALAADNLEPRDLKALTDAADRMLGRLSKLGGVLDYEAPEDRKLRRDLGKAKLAALEKASAQGTQGNTLADLLRLAGEEPT
jgi:hypothetical protein